MSYLIDYEIIDLITHNILRIEPYDARNITSTFIELRLGSKFITLLQSTRAKLNPSELNTEDEFANKFKYSTIELAEGDTYTLAPKEFVLAITKEKITMPKDYIGTLFGRNRLGRLGVLLFCSGGLINPGFSGQLALELYNVNSLPIDLKVGMRIAKMTLQKLSAMPHTIKLSPKIFTDTNNSQRTL